MVNLQSSEEWQLQTSMLLQARPTTTRITTRYNIPNLAAPKFQKPGKRKRDENGSESAEAAGAAKVPRATLTLKTYDPQSGVVLKFTTDRAAEVGRLIAGLGKAGRHMAALPVKEDVTEHVAEEATESIPSAEIPNTTGKTPAPSGDVKAAPPPSGAAKKKKKNKK